jgi:PII-like signaling protein
VNEPGIKLTTYFEERDPAGERFLADALFDLYERHEMRTSVLLRGMQGFGQRHELHTDRLLTLSERLPAVSIAVDSRDRIARAVPEVLELARHGLVSLERTRLITGAGLEHLELPSELGAMLKLTIYGGRSIRSDGDAGYVAAVELLRRCGATGASVLLAVDGTLHGERRRAQFFGRNARVPLMLLTIGAPRALDAALPMLVRLIDEPVVTIERVQVCRSDGQRLAEPPPTQARDETGLPLWQKVMVHAEEQARCEGRPLYMELVRRLREARAAGVTVLRGVRGFYGDRPTIADRVLSLRRNVPLHVVAVDTPAGVRRWWPVIEDVTSDSGLVTVELVPASHALASGRPAELNMASTHRDAPS